MASQAKLSAFEVQLQRDSVRCVVCKRSSSCVCEDVRLTRSVCMRACLQAHQAGGDGAYTTAQQPPHAKGLEQCCVVKQGSSAASSVVQARELTFELCVTVSGVSPHQDEEEQ